MHLPCLTPPPPGRWDRIGMDVLLSEEVKVATGVQWLVGSSMGA